MIALMAGLALAAGASGTVFDDSPHPSPPDYAQAQNWMFRETAGDGRAADIFYIQPTTYRAQEWNQDLANQAANRWTDVSVGDRQVSAFADCCRRFVPRYRQASSRAFTAMQGDGPKAYALAYSDVVRAFRAYIAHDNGNRPFILAGHSQGALHGLRLIREEIAGTPLARRLVVAYLPGIGMPIGALPADVGACTTPRQTRCIASWNSFDGDADTSGYVARATQDYVGLTGGRALFCVNPLTFDTRRPDAGFRSGKGALPGPAVDGARPAIVRHHVSARCDGNVLRVTTKLGLSVERLPGGNLHMNDIAFFWGDIRANSAVRVKAWRAEKGMK